MTADLVLLFVDGSAAGYRALHEAHCVPFRPCHVRSLGELRYALRSIDMHAPWARRVFLVVQSDAHVPSWLDRAQVDVVHHDAFIPAEVLPTFNQFPIQANLHRIPGLGERFVLWHDDYFVGRTTPLTFFFSHNRTRIVRDSPIPFFLPRLRPDDVFARFAWNTARLFSPRGLDAVLGRYLYPHMPLAVHTADWARMVASHAHHASFQATVRRKVEADASNPDGVLLDTLYANQFDRVRNPLRKGLECLVTQGARLGSAALNRVLGTRLPVLYGVYGIRNDPHATARAMRRLERERPRFFCVNDDAYDCFEQWHDGFEVNPRSLAAFTRTMNRLFPLPSRFEVVR